MRPREPEIIDVTPGHKGRAKSLSWGARLPILISLLKTMLFSLAPALLAMYGCYWLVVRGMMGDYFAWILLLIAAPVALLLSVIALPINVFLFFSVVAVLLGKTPPQRTSPANSFGSIVRTVRQKEDR